MGQETVDANLQKLTQLVNKESNLIEKVLWFTFLHLYSLFVDNGQPRSGSNSTSITRSKAVRSENRICERECLKFPCNATNIPSDSFFPSVVFSLLVLELEVAVGS